MNGVNGIPPRRYMLPKVYLGDPVRVSIPMVARSIPIIVTRSPLLILSPTSQLIDVIAISSTMVISAGPNFSPTFARAGPTTVRMIIPIVPPTKDAMMAVISA